MYQIKLTRTAKKNLRKITSKDQIRIINALDTKLAQNPKLGESLKGKLKGKWKLRIGKYRVIYSIQRKVLTIYIFDIAHRKDIYR